VNIQLGFLLIFTFKANKSLSGFSGTISQANLFYKYFKASSLQPHDERTEIIE
jgi:hypothetical protein